MGASPPKPLNNSTALTIVSLGVVIEKRV